MKISFFIFRLAKLFLICCIFFIPSVSKAQPDTLWARAYGGVDLDFGRSILISSEGNFIIAGGTESTPTGDSDLWLLRVDENGDTLRTRRYGGDGHDGAWWVAQVHDGGFIAAGYNFSDSDKNGDVFLVRTDENFDSLWTKTYGGTDRDQGVAVVESDDSAFVVLGFTYETASGLRDAWLFKVDGNGDLIWSKTYGGSATEMVHGLAKTSDGGYIFTGWTHSFGLPGTNLWLVKTDENGDTLWTRTFHETNEQRGYFVMETPDTNYIVTGEVQFPGDIHNEYWIIKTDLNGEELWSRSYGGIGVHNARTLDVTSDGGFIIGGWSKEISSSNLEGFLIRIDSAGNLLWSKDLLGDGGEKVLAVRELDDGGFIVAGETNSFGNGLLFDVWLVRLAPPRIKLEVPQTTAEVGDTVSLPLSMYFPPEYSIDSISVSIIGYGENLSFKNADTIGGMLGAAGWNFEYVSNDTTANFFMWGEESLKGNGDLFEMVFVVNGIPDGFVPIEIDSAYFDSVDVPIIITNGGIFRTVGVDEEFGELPSAFDLKQNYPNPFNPVTTIKFDLPAGAHSTLIIYNLRGQEVVKLVDGRLESGRYSFEWDASGAASGIYIYQLISGDFIESRKMVLLK